jgi:hypothetical protein
VIGAREPECYISHMSATFGNLRYALRMMRRKPGFTAIFSLVDQLLLWSIPARELFRGCVVRRYNAGHVPKEYNEKVAYIHWNPVEAGLVERPEDWKWSSLHDYRGTVNAQSGRGSPIPVD